MSKKFYGGIDIQTQSQLKLFNSADTFSVSLKAPTLAGNVALVLPASDTTNGALVSDGAGNLSLALLANANISASAAIAYSKLALTGSIVNADVNASAAIAYSKLAALTVNRALVSNGSGVVTVATTTDTEIGYVNGVTSAIQTQLNGKANTALSNLTVSGLTTDDLLYATSSSAVGRLAIGSDGNVLTVVSGAPAWAAPAGASYKTDWITADTTTKTVTHSLGSLDVIVQIYDKANGQTIEIDSVTRTSTSVVTLVSSAAPNASGWRVMIHTV